MATYKKQLKDQNGDNIIPALGTATVTSTNIDWSTTGDQSSYVDLGAIRICFGSATVTSIPTGAFGEKAVDVTFPAAFASTPSFSATPGDMPGGCGEYAAYEYLSTTGTKIWVGHSGSTSGTSATVKWIAIGVKPTS